MKKKAIFLVLSAIVCFLFFNITGMAAQTETEEKRVVRVGFHEKEGFFENNNGKLTGFGVDYLNSIATYLGWEYEFLEGTKTECIQWIRSDYIDLLIPVYVDDEIGKTLVSSKIIGEDFCYIYKLNNNFEIAYKDYDKFKECIVGVVNGSGLESRIQEHCSKNKFHFDSIVNYATIEEAQNELADGKIDLLATDSYVNITNMKVVDSFVSGLITIAAKNEEILEEWDDAVDKIKLDNPGYTEELRVRHFSEGSQKNLEYSLEELEFLNNDLTYKVAMCKNQYPVSFVTESGEYRGIAPDIIRIAQYHTGIEFETVYVENYEEGERLLQEGKVDVLTGSVLEKQDVKELNIKAKNSSGEENQEYFAEFFDIDMVLVGKKGTDISATLKVAVPSYLERGMLYLEEMFPQYEYVLYEDDTACFDAIINNEVQLAIQSETKINELGIYDQYKELRNLKNIAGNFVATFVMHTNDKMLVGIIKKTMDGLSESTLSTVASDNISHIEAKGMTIEEFLDMYLADIIVACMGILAVLLGGIMYRKYKREMLDKEKAYRDSVANINSMEKFRIDVEPILGGIEKVNYYVIAVDLDKFKVINDLYGYERGDKVIAFLARKLKEELGADDYIARSTAEKFVIMKKAGTVGLVEEYLKRVFENVDKDVKRDETHFRMILKAGIYSIEENDYLLSSIIDKANLAKNNMKRGHKSSFEWYSEEMRRKNIEDKEVENDMAEALGTGQFQVYLQPQVDLRTKKIVSAEALVRWIHPQKGMIPPFRFIPVFENNGFITRLDLFIWEEVIKTIVGWRNTGKKMVPIAINLSRIDVEKEGVVDKLIALMNKYHLESQWVKTELTESICLENDGIIMERMEQLKRAGFTIAVDDFGSGYSSLHLLKTMPLDILKIDKGFLDINMNMSKKDAIVIRDVVEMGKHLELQIIMEGVETLEQSQFLESIGCDIAQGYYYGKPMPISEFEKLLETNA